MGVNNYVVEGARLGCPNCPDSLLLLNGPQLIVVSQRWYKQNNNYVATAADRTAASIPPFKACTVKGACTPVVIRDWLNTNEYTYINSSETLLFNNLPVLGSYAFCEAGKGFIYIMTSGQKPDAVEQAAAEAAYKAAMTELCTQLFRDLNDQACAQNPTWTGKLSDQQVKQIATDYVDVTLGLSKAEKDTDGYTSIWNLGRDVQKSLCSLNGTPDFGADNFVDPYAALINNFDREKNSILNEKDNQKQYIYSDEIRNAARSHYYPDQFNQAIVDRLAFQAVVPNSFLKDLLIGGAVLGVLILGMTTPLWGPAAIGFLQTAGISAAIAAKEIWSLFLINPTLLLYNPNVQNFLVMTLIGALDSTTITKNADGSYSVEIDGKRFLVWATMGALFMAVGEIYNHWGAARDVAVRKAYVKEVRALESLEKSLRQQGKSSEEIARALHQARRDLGVQYKDLTSPEMLEEIYKRNIDKYGDKLGPSINYLRERNYSWEAIIESAKRPGSEFNDLAGIK